MNKHLIIDNKDLGPVVGYRQNRELQRWSFLMEAGYYISIDWNNIKFFTSNGDLVIFTYTAHSAE